jgi:hypothetical protein
VPVLAAAAAPVSVVGLVAVRVPTAARSRSYGRRLPQLDAISSIDARNGHALRRDVPRGALVIPVVQLAWQSPDTK